MHTATERNGNEEPNFMFKKKRRHQTVIGVQCRTGAQKQLPASENIFNKICAID